MPPLKPWQKFLLLFLSLIFLTQTLFYIVLGSIQDPHERMVYLRLRWAVNFQFVLFLIGTFNYGRVMGLFEPPESISKDRKLYLAYMNDSRLYRKLTSSILLFIGFCSHLTHFLYFLPAHYPSVSYLCGLCFGIWLYLFGFLFGYSIFNFLFRIVRCSHCLDSILSKLLSIRMVQYLTLDTKFQTKVCVALTVVCSLAGVLSASFLNVHYVDIPVKNLSSDLQGYRIALLTDIHLGGPVTQSHVQDVVDETNKLKPDLTVIVGDLFDGTTSQLGMQLGYIRHLKSRHGVYYITGNHEYYYGNIDQWLKLINVHGVKVLRNENADLGKICLAGVDDVSAAKKELPGHKMDLEKALDGCTPKHFTILLAHNPKAAKIYLKEALNQSLNHADLILSGTSRRLKIAIKIYLGHIHAGQFYVLAPLVWAFVPFFHGLYSTNLGTQVYVSGGIYYWAIPMKTFNNAELTLIRLVRKL